MLLFAAQVQAQLLLQPTGKEFGYDQKFNPVFISANRIREIKCILESKRDGDRIRNTQRIVLYRFDTEGNTTLVSNINLKLGDTSVTVYTYAGNKLQCEVKNDAAGMFNYCYSYNPEGMPLTRSYGRTERSKNLLGTTPPQRVVDVATESYEHVRMGQQLHTTLNNASGRPYLREIRYYDHHGYLQKYTHSYILSSERYEETYAYNRNGWLSERTLHTADTRRSEYQYDNVGNLIEEKHFVNDTLSNRREYVYEGSNMLLRAELMRDDAAQTIYITNYTYTYW